MNRSEIISKLMTEGFTSNTLVKLSDKQIALLSDRILGEQQQQQAGIINVKSGSPDEKTLKQQGKSFMAYEEVDIEDNNDDEFIDIETPAGSKDFKLFKRIVNIGIDSDLEGFTKSKFKKNNYDSIGEKFLFRFHKDEVPLLLKRLQNLYDEYGIEEIADWIQNIEDYEHEKNEINEETPDADNTDEKDTSKDNLISFTIPDWAASYLIKSDPSGLEDEDIEKVDEFSNKIVSEFGNANFMLGNEAEEDLGFCYRNDIDNLGANCKRMYIKPDKNNETNINEKREFKSWFNNLIENENRGFTTKREITEIIDRKLGKNPITKKPITKKPNKNVSKTETKECKECKNTDTKTKKEKLILGQQTESDKNKIKNKKGGV